MVYAKTTSFDKARRYERRKHKVNTTIKTTNPDAYRLVANKSNTATYVQLVSPKGDVVLNLTDKTQKGTGVEKAFAMGELAAKEVAKAKVATSLVFDRNGYRYHGRIKALAEGLRAGGITI